MSDITRRIAADLGLLEEWVGEAINNAPNNYKLIHIDKKSPAAVRRKEKRAICQPAVETKMIQRWLLATVFAKLPVSRVATAFEPGTSIVKNARIHRGGTFSVRADVKAFFPSIRVDDLVQVINSNSSKLPIWFVDPALELVIRKTCFLSNGRLPIGYPSSPKIANVVMHALDEQLHSAISADQVRYGRARLTRYADDYVFSSDLQGSSKAFVELLEYTFKSCPSPKLSLNPDKTKLMMKRSGTTLVTGLRVKPSGEIGVHAKYKDQIRLLLSLYSKRALRKEDLESLRGHLMFIRHSDPSLFTKLSLKYTSEIADLTARKDRLAALRLAA